MLQKYYSKMWLLIFDIPGLYVFFFGLSDLGILLTGNYTKMKKIWVFPLFFDVMAIQQKTNCGWSSLHDLSYQSLCKCLDRYYQSCKGDL